MYFIIIKKKLVKHYKQIIIYNNIFKNVIDTICLMEYMYTHKGKLKKKITFAF